MSYVLNFLHDLNKAALHLHLGTFFTLHDYTPHTGAKNPSKQKNKIFWKQTSMHAYTLQITHPRRSAKPATSF